MKTEGKSNLEFLKESFSSPYIMELDKSFKLLDAKETRGKRRYLVSNTDITESFILGLEKEDMLLSRGTGTMKETSCLTITFKSNQEATIRDMFAELKAEHEPSTLDIIMSLSRTYSKNEQGSDEWKYNDRDENFTSTHSMLGKGGTPTDEIYRNIAYGIAYAIGGQVKNEFISSMVSESEAHERGIDWVDPKSRGTNQEKYTVELVEEKLKLKVPTESNGVNKIDDMCFADSDDNSFVADKDYKLPNGQVIKKGMRVLLEVKNPSLFGFVNPDYKNKSHIWVQNQHHLIVGGGDVVLFIKHFKDLSLDMELVYLDEDYARKFLEHMVIAEEYKRERVSHYVNDYYDNQDISF